MYFANFSKRNSQAAVVKFLLPVLILIVAVAAQSSREKPPRAAKSGRTHPPTLVSTAGYVGSEECALCHNDIYEKYSRTDMGRSMVKGDASLLKNISTTASVFDQRLNRHFEQYVKDGALFQSEFESNADGKNVFRDTRKVEWIIGAGANGMGGIVQRGDYLFEAPLSFYSNANSWALSPGYQYADYGFSRPILPGCISCHSGRAQPIPDGNGKFRNPPFQQLAVGCENCHGPGEAHIAAASSETIVNPAKLSGWLADNVCLPCHQTGDARVLRAGKDFNDFRPGTALDSTLAIFMVPFNAQSLPQDDLLEHYLSMRLSKCFRESAGKLSCITCHDPHTQPTATEAPDYFRARCLTCHTEQSCSVALTERQKQSPADSCIGCHMPKRDVKVISHSVLTNHRIVRRPQEPFPDAAFNMTTAQLPDLVHLSAEPGKKIVVPPLTLLQAYRQVMLSHPEYRERYWKLAKDLEKTEPNNIAVLQALADLALQQRSLEGLDAAIAYLDRARLQGTTQPADYEQLAKMLIATRQEARAVEVLRQGIELIPHDANLYRLLGSTYLSLQKHEQACQVLSKANQNFPQDDAVRNLLKQCGPTDAAPR
jgi:tetratricopeptide repeat protein